MPLRKGQTNNPNGRPRKERALTTLLERAGNTRISVPGEDAPVMLKKYVPDLVWQGVVNGHVLFPDGFDLKLGAKEWVALVQWLYTHIDGTKSVNEHGGEGGGPIKIEVVFGDDPFGLANAAHGTEADTP